MAGDSTEAAARGCFPVNIRRCLTAASPLDSLPVPRASCISATRAPRCSAGCSRAITAAASYCASRIRTPSAARSPTPRRSWRICDWMGLAVGCGPASPTERASRGGRGVSPVAPRSDLRAPFGHAGCAWAHLSLLLHAAGTRSVAQGAAGRRPAAAVCRHLPRAVGRGARAQERAGHLTHHAFPRPQRARASSSTTWCTERSASPPTTSAISSCGAPTAARRSSSAMPSTMPRWASRTCCAAKIT